MSNIEKKENKENINNNLILNQEIMKLNIYQKLHYVMEQLVDIKIDKNGVSRTYDRTSNFYAEEDIFNILKRLFVTARICFKYAIKDSKEKRKVTTKIIETKPDGTIIEKIKEEEFETSFIEFFLESKDKRVKKICNKSDIFYQFINIDNPTDIYDTQEIFDYELTTKRDISQDEGATVTYHIRRFFQKIFLISDTSDNNLDLDTINNIKEQEKKELEKEIFENVVVVNDNIEEINKKEIININLNNSPDNLFNKLYELDKKNDFIIKVMNNYNDYKVKNNLDITLEQYILEKISKTPSSKSTFIQNIKGEIKKYESL